MGFGGGSVYILYSVLWGNAGQLEAQGKNLFLFIPCSVTALAIYIKNKFIDFKLIFPICLGGILGVLTGKKIIDIINVKYLRIAFAVFLIIFGIYTVFNKEK